MSLTKLSFHFYTGNQNLHPCWKRQKSPNPNKQFILLGVSKHGSMCKVQNNKCSHSPHWPSDWTLLLLGCHKTLQPPFNPSGL